MSDYVHDLNQKLEAARKRVTTARQIKTLKQSSPALFEIMDLEISLALNRMTSAEPLSHEAYLSAHGEVKGIRRIRDLLNSKEAEEDAAVQESDIIKDQIEQFNNDKAAK